MIPFFRKIRNLPADKAGKMADDNRPLKPAWPAARYMRYAIGEIALVVIGILIALQINNWNEGRKERVLEKKYLESLLIDLNRDRIQLSWRIESLEWHVKMRNYMLENVEENDIEKSLDYYITIGTALQFNAETPTYDDLKASGNLNSIQNKKVKDLMSLYKSKLALINSMLYSSDIKLKNEYNDIIYDYIDPQFKAYWWKNKIVKDSVKNFLDSTNYKFDFQGIRSDARIEPKIDRIIGIDSELIVWYGTILKEDIDPTILVIKNEIK